MQAVNEWLYISAKLSQVRKKPPPLKSFVKQCIQLSVYCSCGSDNQSTWISCKVSRKCFDEMHRRNLLMCYCICHFDHSSFQMQKGPNHQHLQVTAVVKSMVGLGVVAVIAPCPSCAPPTAVAAPTRRLSLTGMRTTYPGLCCSQPATHLRWCGCVIYRPFCELPPFFVVFAVTKTLVRWGRM